MADVSYTGGSQTFNENPQASVQQMQPIANPAVTAPLSSNQLAAYYQAMQAAQSSNPAMTTGTGWYGSPGQITASGVNSNQYQGSGGYQSIYGPTGTSGFANSPNAYIAQGQTAPQLQNSGQYQSVYGNAGINGFLNSPNFIANNGGTYNPNQGVPGSAQNFFQSPEYQALYGSQAAQNNSNAIANGTYNPTTAFQQDPSYQYNMNQALAQVNNASAARGLLESGQTQRDLLTTASGLQNQYYQNWLGQQTQLFGNYQNNLNTNLNNYQSNVNNQYQNQQTQYTNALNNYQSGNMNQYNAYNNNQISGYNNYQTQLANLANLGLQNNGASQAQSNGQLLANLFSGNNMNAGTNTSNNYMNSGNNITQLLAQLGYTVGGQQLNTSAAQSNNLFQGNQFQAQIDNEIMNQQAGQQQGMANYQGNQNAMNLFNNNSGMI